MRPVAPTVAQGSLTGRALGAQDPNSRAGDRQLEPPSLDVTTTMLPAPPRELRSSWNTATSLRPAWSVASDGSTSAFGIRPRCALSDSSQLLSPVRVFTGTAVSTAD